MLIIGAFEHRIELEQALAEVEQAGVPRRKLLVVPMDTQRHPAGDINKTDDFFGKGIEVGIASGTFLSVFGSSIGFILKWGPIIWGLLSAIIGFGLGFLVYFLLHKNNRRLLPKRLPEVTVIVDCPEGMAAQVMDIFWRYRVLTVGQYHRAE